MPEQNEIPVPFYPELLDRYTSMIDKHLGWVCHKPVPDKTELKHLKDMIETLRNDHTQSLTKKHRWLGFIQGVLICRGLTSVDRERNVTRDMFKGA